ncbi:hypothetical protein B296_00053081, partial [Ensete ventricosum]
AGGGGIADRVCRPVEPKLPDRTTHEKVAGFPTFVVGRRPADSKIDSGGKTVAAPIFTKAKARHEQVSSRDDPGPSALAQKHDQVTPRVGCYLAGGDPPPLKALFYKGMQWKPETGLQSIHRDAHTGRVQTERALPGSRRALESTDDKGPEDAPEELASGSL